MTYRTWYCWLHSRTRNILNTRPLSSRLIVLAMFPGFCSAVMLTAGAAEPVMRPPVKDTPSEEELVLKLKGVQQQSTGSTYVPPKSSGAAAAGDSQDLIESSEIICFGDAMTLIPKRAILLTPKNLALRLKASAAAQLVTWGAFLPANRSWITTVEVSMEQAAGKVPISEATNDSMTKTGKLVVATYNGNPISVLTTRIPTTSVPIKPLSQP